MAMVWQKVPEDDCGVMAVDKVGVLERGCASMSRKRPIFEENRSLTVLDFLASFHAKEHTKQSASQARKGLFAAVCFGER
jgi:hypothetical protein